MSQEAVTARLEAVAARLEAAASKLGRGGGGGGGGDDDEVPAYVAEYEAVVNGQVKALGAAYDKLGLPEVSQAMISAFAISLDVIRKAPKSKKPTNVEFKAVAYDPIEKLARAAVKKAFGRKTYSDPKVNDLAKKMEQLVRIPLWVMHSAPALTPMQHIKDMCQGDVETAINAGIRNNANAAQKADFQALLKAFKAVVAAMDSFIKNVGFKTGIEWNPKGGSITQAAAAASGGPSAAPAQEEQKEAPAKTAAKKPAAAAGGGMAAVMGSLSKGLDITKGMKKVTKDMKTKNRKDRSGKVATAPKRTVQKRTKSGAPDVAFRGGRWFVENFDEDTGADKKDGNGVIQVEKANVKSNVFVTMCDNAFVQIKPKVKAVTIDNCVKCTVYVSEVVSTIELVNSKSIKVIVMPGGKVPSFAVDKCESPLIILSRSALEAAPDIFSSNVTAMNVEIPGATDADNNRECPVPEQFVTKIDPVSGNATTTATEH